MTSIRTFRDFAWRSHHHLPSKFGAAAHVHWHNYRARFWFTGEPDQDKLVEKLEQHFSRLHGCALNLIIQSESTDEAIAAWLLFEAQSIGKCVRVMVENDGQRGAEAFE